MKYKGFFSEEKDISIDKVLHKKNKKSNCEECGLFSKCISPMMDYSGEGRKKIMEIAEAPGGEEDKRGTHFVGDVGEMLRDITIDFNVDIDRDWFKDNTLACRPPKNRTPKKREIVLCRPRLFKNIEKLKPKKIILFGKAAVSSLMEDRIKIDRIEKWVGRAIPDQKFNAWIFPTYHPSYLYRDRTNVVLEKILRSNIENAIKWDKKFVKEDPYKDIKILKSSDDIITYLSRILEQKLPISLDYETTGLKPHAEGHEIYCASITSDEIKTISFPIIDNRKFHFLLRKILTDRRIKKIAQNIKFEASWTRFILGHEVKGWLWDTMIAAHILDNREASTGLKFQIYVNYGIVGYDDKIKPFLKSHSKNGNAFNRIKKAPINDVLLYCGVDSKYTHKIWKEQEKKISPFLMKGYQLFHNGILEFEKIQANGIRVDAEYYEKQDKHLERRIKRIEKKIQNSDEVRLWKEKTKKDFNIRSPKQIKKLLFNLLEYNPSKQTAKGNDAIDGEVLERIGTDFTLNLMEYQRLYKLRNTYLAAFLREPVNDIMRPFFDLHIPRSFRSCIAKGSYIDIVRDISKYPKGIPIENVKKGDYIYCFDNNLQPKITKVKWAGKTGYKKVIRLHWRGKKRTGYLDVTPEHLIRHISGGYIQAKNLVGDLRKDKKEKVPKIEVLSLARRKDQLYFTRCMGKNNTGILEHRFIYSNLINKLDDNYKIHHKDGNHLNHCLSNLEKITSSDHARLHCIFNDPSSREKNIKVIKNNWKLGKVKVKKGDDHPSTIKFSKFKCLRILAKVSGRITKIPYDFNSFKYLLLRRKIDYKLVKLRYDKNDKYISKKRLLELNEKGISKVQKEIGHNYYKLKKLYSIYNITFERKWANQYGSFTINNHVITKIEYLNIYKEVYDLELEKFNNFFANEICVHNSSHQPNFQNIPVRNKETQRVTRKGIISSPGNILLEADFKGIEVCISASYHHDPTMITYITDKSTDMHRDEAMQLFFLEKEQITSFIRYISKNMWVFPQFYNSYYEQCAPNIWEAIQNQNTSEGISLIVHLKRKGITSYKKFENHTKKCEKIFWYEKFKVYRKWKEKLWDKYQKRGEVKFHTGFACSGLMKRNAVVNYPIQGSAFHCLLWSLIQLNRISRLESWKSKIIGQIHDSIIMDVDPKELNHVVSKIKQVTEVDLRNHWKWINVPMSIEIEISEIDGSWHQKKEIENEKYK